MQRRTFIASSTAFAISGPTLLMEACSPAQVVADVEGVMNKAAAILTAAGQTTWAAEFRTASQALQAAYAMWDQSTTSTVGQKVAAALNAIVAATAIILPNDPFASLIDECVALADLALGFWTTKALSVAHNPHIGAVPAPKSAADAKRRWNTLSVGPLAAAHIA